MITITLKIKEKSKKGRIFLDLAKMFYDDKKEVELIDLPKKISNIKKEKSIYNPDFIKKIKEAEKNIKDGKTISFNSESIWDCIE